MGRKDKMILKSIGIGIFRVKNDDDEFECHTFLLLIIIIHPIKRLELNVRKSSFHEKL
jgi:hypothetical protein